MNTNEREVSMPTTSITDIRTVAVNVSNQDDAIAFYVETLGFEKQLEAQISPTMRWIEVAPPGASTSIALTATEEEATTDNATDTGIRFTVPDAAAERAAMRERGVTVGDLLHWDEVPAMFSFDDPDGNRFYIVEQP
jgi:lactoylglutathione lyase